MARLGGQVGYILRNNEKREKQLRSELERILCILSGEDVEKIILFGSLAQGDITSTSDIDLIVVQDTELGFLERIDYIYSLIRPRRAVDILVYTRQELERLKHESSFVRKALLEGEVLYEKELC